MSCVSDVCVFQTTLSGRKWSTRLKWKTPGLAMNSTNVAAALRMSVCLLKWTYAPMDISSVVSALLALQRLPLGKVRHTHTHTHTPLPPIYTTHTQTHTTITHAHIHHTHTHYHHPCTYTPPTHTPHYAHTPACKQAHKKSLLFTHMRSCTHRHTSTHLRMFCSVLLCSVKRQCSKDTSLS